MAVAIDVMDLANRVLKQWRDDQRRQEEKKYRDECDEIERAGGWEAWMDQRRPGWRTEPGGVWGRCSYPGPMVFSHHDINRLAEQLSIALQLLGIG